jgi:hypothetical protein
MQAIGRKKKKPRPEEARLLQAVWGGERDSRKWFPVSAVIALHPKWKPF